VIERVIQLTSNVKNPYRPLASGRVLSPEIQSVVERRRILHGDRQDVNRG